MNGKPHYQITIFESDPLLSPDSLKEGNRRLREQSGLGLRAVAIVIPDGSPINLVRYEMNQAYTGVDIEHRIFTDKSRALAWIDDLRYAGSDD
jgi:hypothetical protein